ncbi:MAG: DinB family protein [Candidatus Eisenbacteria bacterium]
MNAPELDPFVRIVRTLFVEAYQGADGPTWFVSNGPDGGLFAVLAKVTAEQASRAAPPGTPTIAAHAEHLRWSLANVNSVARGGEWNPDWSSSWSVSSVDEGTWASLRAKLRAEFSGVLEAIDAGGVDPSDPIVMTGMAALAPHAAHHLGTIRQLARLLATEPA